MTDAPYALAKVRTRGLIGLKMDKIRTQERFLVTAHLISEGEEDRRLQARALIEHFNFGVQQPGWIFAAMHSLIALGFLEPLMRDGGEEEQFVQLTAAGRRRAEKLLSERKGGIDGSELVPDGGFSVMGAGVRTYPQSFQRPAVVPFTVDSAAGAGSSRFEVLGAEKAAALRGMMLKAERDLEQLGIKDNSLKEQAFAIIIAVRALIAAPDPPKKVIIDLLTIAAAIAGIGSLFFAALQVIG